MAITDLIAKLVLDSSDWSTDLKKSSRELKAFQDGVKNAGDFLGNLSGSLASTAAKFAGWAGAGLAAKEGLEKFLRAGQTTSDWLDQNVNAWKGLFDEFFVALNSGSVQGFLSNMGDVAESIREATRAVDAFNDAKSSMDVLQTVYDVQQRSLLEQIKRNKDNPELVDALKEQLIALEQEMSRNIAGVVSQQKQVSMSTADSLIYAPAKTGVGGLDSKATRFLFGGLSPDITRLKRLLETEAEGSFDAMLNVARKLASNIDEVLGSYSGNEAYSNKDKNLTAKVVAAFEKKYGVSMLEVLRWAELGDEGGRDTVREAIKKLFEVQRSQFEFRERNTEIFNMGTTGGGGSGNLSKVYAAGSLGWYSQQIAALVEKQKGVTDANELQRLQVEIDRLKRRKETIEIAVKLADGLEGSIPSKIGGVNATIKAENAIMPTGGGLPFVGDNAVNQVVSLEQGLGGVAEMLRTISGLTNEGTQAWLNYASNALSAMRGLMVALQSVGMANAASQSAAAGPFGWMQVPIAIASMLAAFASIPKFSRGGIVPGNSYSGDKVLAGLNSREMVLTQSQQSKLFAMLNGASISSGGSVKFEIRADKLVGVLDNYNRRRRKIV